MASTPTLIRPQPEHGVAGDTAQSVQKDFAEEPPVRASAARQRTIQDLADLARPGARQHRWAFAHPGHRFCATLADVAILLTLAYPMHALYTYTESLVMTVIAVNIVGLWYYARAISSRAQCTIGQQFLRLKVVSATFQEPISYFTAFVRYVLFWFPVYWFLPMVDAFFFVNLDVWTAASIGLVFAVWYAPILLTHERVGVHDLLTGSRVVHVPYNKDEPSY